MRYDLGWIIKLVGMNGLYFGSSCALKPKQKLWISLGRCVKRKS